MRLYFNPAVLCLYAGVVSRVWAKQHAATTEMPSHLRRPSISHLSLIDGYSGALRYQYDPSRLQVPQIASMVNCHGFVLDENDNIFMTYETNNTLAPDHCLIQWNSDGTSPRFVNTSAQLCAGTAHGLTISREATTEFLYHANNDQRLTKTFLNGTIVWQSLSRFDHNSSDYRPTWMAVPPDGPYIYLCDGYGSNYVYLVDRETGQYLGQKWGGRGDEHGEFATNHGCVYDPVYDQIVVADREHGRLEYFDYYTVDSGKKIYGVFDYSHTVETRQHGVVSTKIYSRPCILRRQPQQGNLAAVPDLTGTVQIVDEQNTVVSVVNVSHILGHLGHLHPHDAQILTNGDLIVATWNPGRVSYWKRM